MLFWRRPAGRVGNVPTHEGCGDGVRYGKANRFPHIDRAKTRGYLSLLKGDITRFVSPKSRID